MPDQVGQIMGYRVEWWTIHQGALQTHRCRLEATAQAQFDEKSKNPEIVEVRIIEERMIAQHATGVGSARED